MSKHLIELDNVSLTVPGLQAKAESMLINPVKMISDFYFQRDTRCKMTLLENINFSLEAGQRIGILGRNGAGKSTLLRLVGKIYEPSKGSIKYNAEPMGFFSTQNGILPEATGLENIYLRGLTVEPDVLLLDEWIGAGDADFKNKITNRLNEIIDISRG
jgi:ABC-type polysaccharide/polyol phosphate transport system ATPase subunit